jgi:plastocyanin
MPATFRRRFSSPGRGAVLTFVALCAFGLGACGGEMGEPPPAPPGAVPHGERIGTGSIVGRVIFEGPPPTRRPLKMSGESACRRPGHEPLSEDVVVQPDGTLRNVLVHVVTGLGDRQFAPPGEPAVLDQEGCVFAPHVLAAQTNQVIVFKNSDPTVHNVRALARENRTFNVAMSGKGRTVRRFFSKPEIVRIRCDIHAWMGAFVAVDDHPFHAVTGDGGSFALGGLPAGEYVVEAWQEALGTSRRTVRLADGETVRIEFAFGSPPHAER